MPRTPRSLAAISAIAGIVAGAPWLLIFMAGVVVFILLVWILPDLAPGNIILNSIFQGVAAVAWVVFGIFVLICVVFFAMSASSGSKRPALKSVGGDTGGERPAAHTRTLQAVEHGVGDGPSRVVRANCGDAAAGAAEPGGVCPGPFRGPKDVEELGEERGALTLVDCVVRRFIQQVEAVCGHGGDEQGGAADVVDGCFL